MKAYTVISYLFLSLLPLTPVTAEATELMVFPAKGQTSQQQAADEQECRGWAIQQSGVNPATLAAPAPSQQRQGGDRAVVRGALAGAAIGGIGGSMGGEFGKGAAVGAAIGGVGKGIQNRRQQQTDTVVNQQAQQTYQQQMDKFNRAYSACLEGKGYTVK